MSAVVDVNLFGMRIVAVVVGIAGVAERVLVEVALIAVRNRGAVVLDVRHGVAIQVVVAGVA